VSHPVVSWIRAKEQRVKSTPTRLVLQTIVVDAMLSFMRKKKEYISANFKKLIYTVKLILV
jgi:hypothetical protein